MAGIIRWKDPLTVVMNGEVEAEGYVIFELEVEDGQVLEESSFEFIRSFSQVKGFEGFTKDLEKQLWKHLADMEYNGDYEGFVIYL